VFTIGQEEAYEEDNVAEELRHHGWFIAFAPIEAPEIALAVLVENGGGGSTSAAPVAKRVFDAYFGIEEPL
jgi:penicillin-binding protein 2